MVVFLDVDNESLQTSHNDNFFDVPEYGSSLPEIPEEIGPVLDPENFGKPLNAFSDDDHAVLYGTRSMLDSEVTVPACPSTFTDRYLEPTLSRNEYTRLTNLWYFTRGLRHDSNLLQKIDQIVDMVKQSLGWEFGIVGIVDADTFARVVTASTMPLAVIPRRESPCSHTVNQPPGTVFSITDMQQDWRFRKSPTAEYGGLRSYAGTQIYLSRHGEESICFGSLCVASRIVEPSLSQGQKKSLLRAANMISGELVSRNRLRRLKERQTMLEILNKLRSAQGADLDEEAVIEVVSTRYPDHHIFVARVHQNQIVLAKRKTIDLDAIQDGIWEDTENIKSNIASGKSANGQCADPVRALVGHIVLDQQCLTVASRDMKHIFDDLDVWFIDQCAQIINITQQAKHLGEALKAKERFLSSIRHELRTPIHGILSSVELLTEELRSRNLIGGEASPSDYSVEALLRTIRSSGTELMTTVNNILRLNAISTSANATLSMDLIYDLNSIEQDLLSEVLGSCAEDTLMGLSLCFRYHLETQTSVIVDWEMLKEILKALVFNSIAATQNGTITVTTTYNEDQELLLFDVIDTGTGIKSEDHERIFVPFEKIHEHSKGAGLGLSLANLMASSLRGTLRLVSSEIGSGSHFQLEIPRIQLASRASSRPVRSSYAQIACYLPTAYYIQAQSERNLHLLSHVEKYLAARGMRRSDIARGSLIVMNEPDPLKSYENVTMQQLAELHAVLVITSSPIEDSLRSSLVKSLKPHHVFSVTGPVHTSRLDEILHDVDTTLSTHYARPVMPPQQFSETQSIVQSLSALSSDTASSNVQTTEVTPPVTPAAEIQRLTLQPAIHRPIKALLVDDNKVNLSVLQFYCKKQKITHTSAMNGNEAINSVKDVYSQCNTIAEPFTLILMDLQMPECSGTEATQQIRAYEDEHKLQRSTIFMITGQDSLADRKASFSAGCDEFFCKPVSMKRLSQAISLYFPDSPVK